MKTLTERLDDGLVLCAEGYLFELERRGYLKAGPFVPEVVLDHPGAVTELHRELLRAGAEVMVAFTYYAHRSKMQVVDREHDLEALNRQALRLATEVAREGDALVAGNICNTWEYDPASPVESSRVVRAMYEEQVGWAVDAGADLVVCETHDYLGEALIGLEVIRAAGLSSVVTFAATTRDATTLDGFPIVEACRQLDAAGADVVGLNCARGPETMLPLLCEIRAAVSCHVGGQPVPYRTTPEQPTFQSLASADGTRGFPTELDPYTCTRSQMAAFADKALAADVRFIGICCGGAPHHVRAMAERLGRTPPASRYSPEIALHPILGDTVKAKEAERLADWKD
jgi:betaine-homocysteine S-methyltransferase